MTMLKDMVRAPDGRVIALRCSQCGLVFANRPPGTSWKEHSDHTWTHGMPATESGDSTREGDA